MIQLHLDGNVELLLPDRSIAVVPLHRLTKLIDGIEQLEDMWGDELEDDAHMHDMAYSDSEGDEIVEIQTEDGQWHHYHGAGDDEDEWVEDGVDESSQMDVDDEQTTSSIAPEEADLSTNGVEKSITGAPMLSSLSSHNEDNSEQETEWKRFDILPNAPVDHAYYSTTPSQPSRAFLSRLQKEYRALSNSLPGNSTRLLVTCT
jgi:ubiquitin-conjugating enzyme E2 O